MVLLGSVAGLYCLLVLLRGILWWCSVAGWCFGVLLGSVAGLCCLVVFLSGVMLRGVVLLEGWKVGVAG